MTRRYSLLTSELGVDTQLKQLRHYSATDPSASSTLHMVTGYLTCPVTATHLGH